MDEWHVVLAVPKRLNQDVDCYEDPFVFVGRMNENDRMAAL